MSDPQRPSLLRAALLKLGSTYVGVALLGLISVYLSLASTMPARLARVLGVELFEPQDPAELYAYAPFLLLCAALCANILIATVMRIAPRWRNLGAWCSHAGLLILAAAAAWYAVRSISGDSISVRLRNGGWSPVEHVYEKRTFAAYLTPSNGGQPVQTRLPRLLPGGPPRPLNTVLAGAPAGVELRAVRYLPSASLVEVVRNDSPRPVPAVRLWIQDANEGWTETVILCPDWEDSKRYARKGYVLTYQPGQTPESLREAMTTAPTGRTPAMPHDLARILAGPRLPPTLVVTRPDGTRWQKPLEVGEGVDVPLAGRMVRIELQQVLDHAMRAYELAGQTTTAPLHMGHPPPPGPVLEIAAAAGSWRQTILVPFFAFEHLAPLTWLDLPDGRAVGLSFSRLRHVLPGALEIRSTQYETYPASEIPKDYRCEVEIVSGATRRRQTLSLNHPVQVGPYQLSQGSWREDPRRPMQILLIAATRPGLPAIWLGSALICLGFPIAFYLKPLLMRGRRDEP